MAELIPVGNTATAFSAGLFTITQGSPRALFIKSEVPNAGTPYGAPYILALVTQGGNYQPLLVLDSNNINDKGLIVGPGNYALARMASTVSSGADINGS
jgi:hypothetical protein